MIIKNIAGEPVHFGWIPKFGKTLANNETQEVPDEIAFLEEFKASRNASKIEVVSYDPDVSSQVVQEELDEATTLDASDISFDDNETYDTISDAVSALLYLPPTCSLSGGQVNEVGVQVDDAALTWTCNKEMTTRVISGAGSYDAGAGQNGSHTFVGANLTTNSTYTLTVGDGSNTDDDSTTYTFYYPIFYGMDANGSLSGNTLYTTLAKLIQAASGTKNIAYDDDTKYAYFCIEGDVTLSKIEDQNGFDVTSAFTKSYPVSVSSSGLDNDWTRDYTVYRSNNLVSIHATYKFYF